MYRHVSVMVPYMTHAHLKIRGLSRDGELLGLDLQRLSRIYQIAGSTTLSKVFRTFVLEVSRKVVDRYR